MKPSVKLFIFLIGLSIPTISNAQKSDTTSDFNILKAPSNPAFVLMGLNPSDITTVTDPTNFYISILNSTKDLTSFPKSYGFSLAPYWVFGGKNLRWNDFASGKKSFIQTLTFSLGINDTSNVTQLGIGFNFCVLRGKINPAINDTINGVLKRVNDITEKLKNAKEKENPDYINNINQIKKLALLINAYQKQIDSIKGILNSDTARLLPPLRNSIGLNVKNVNDLIVKNNSLDSAFLTEIVPDVDKYRTDLTEKLNKLMPDSNFYRTGLMVSISGGTVIDFLQNSFDYSSTNEVGLWITGGYTSKYVDFLGVIRGIDNPNLNSLDNDNTEITKSNVFDLDVGAQLTAKINKFSGSLEWLYRSYTQSNIGSSYKATINLNYTFAKNQIITFSFGRNFNGVITKGGNLISALNLVSGFGSVR